MSSGSHNRVETLSAPELHAERDVPGERASDAPVITADNVVPFTRLRRRATGAAAPPEIAFDPSQRPAPHFIRDRSRLIVPLLALSLIAHSGLYLLFNRQPPPMASIGLEVMSVEIVLGANTPAGAASAPGENETQSAPADAPKPVETDTETADVKPQPPETPPVETPVETADVKPPPETPPVETAQAAPPQPPVQEPPPEPNEPPPPEKQEVAAAPVEPPPPEPTPEPTAQEPTPRETPLEQQVAALPAEPDPPKPEPPKPEQQVAPVPPREAPRERPPETAKPDKPEPKPVRTREPRPKERDVKPKQERNAKTKQDRAQRTASLDPNATGPRANAAGGVGLGSSQAVSNYKGLVAAHLRRYTRYPDEARSREEGVGTVSFVLDGGGRVTSVGIVRRTGFASLDQALQSAVRRASPFPSPPPGADRSFVQTVRFTAPR
jgi:periplasmic protein TonB